MHQEVDQSNLNSEENNFIPPDLKNNARMIWKRNNNKDLSKQLSNCDSNMADNSSYLSKILNPKISWNIRLEIRKKKELDL